MIYETIPAKYFDHTALAKAIGEAFAIRDCAGYWANKAADELMDDRMSSGDAVEIGEFINWAKNIEFLVKGRKAADFTGERSSGELHGGSNRSPPFFLLTPYTATEHTATVHGAMLPYACRRVQHRRSAVSPWSTGHTRRAARRARPTPGVGARATGPP